MEYVDVFNGDADGICALVQLRLEEPKTSILITGVKRNIDLLKYLESGQNTEITVLDISLAKNHTELLRLLNDGAHVFYYDHHQIGEPISHPSLHLDIDLSADVCTSLIVDKKLKGKYRAWAITAAFGDNLNARAIELATQSNFSNLEIALMQEVGTYINYNGYGEKVEDLFYDPKLLYSKLVQFETPFDFVKYDPDTFNALKQGYLNDISQAKGCPSIYCTNDVNVIQLPNEKWARRVSGVFGNDLANDNHDRAHAIIIDNGDESYLVSIRAPLNKKYGADSVASQFPTGGGRKAAAGINSLPKDHLPRFIKVLSDTYQS
jgi:hypothetical protein